MAEVMKYTKKDKYGIPLAMPWKKVRMQNVKDNELVGKPMNLMDWQAELQTEIGIARLEIRKLEELREASKRWLWHQDKHGWPHYTSAPTELEDKNAAKRRLVAAIKALK